MPEEYNSKQHLQGEELVIWMVKLQDLRNIS